MTHPAIQFLAHLDASPDATFNIEHFTDVPKGTPKPKPDLLARRYANLTLNDVEALLPRLQEFNERGAGIFVARNQCSGHRNAKSVTRVRGVHADMDDVTDAQLVAVTARLAPSIVVQSSPGRQQLYWQTAVGAVLDIVETKAINQCLAELGADSAAVDPSRLLRLPGFKHMKYRAEGKTPIVTSEYHGVCYTAEEIRKAFPPRQSGDA
ncbi:MAG: DNA-primase RepB domain-containing protein, partial [Betaproteobacteria bacterium]